MLTPKRCGIGGIALGTLQIPPGGLPILMIPLASILPGTKCLLTDLPEAIELLDHNISNTGLTSSRVDCAVLDWEKTLSEPIKAMRFDLIIISDCTYNCDTVPSLVNTLLSLLAISPSAIVLVSMKTRHDSEAIFFDLVSSRRLTQLHYASVRMPGYDGSLIDVYLYKSPTSG